MTRSDQPTDVLEAALNLASFGYRVVPIGPGLKRPEMLHWQDKATDDLDKIRRWWGGKYQGHGLGVVTGAGSDVWALDVDAKHGGLDTLGELLDRHGRLPATVTARTGGGGLHYLFRWDPDRPVQTRRDTRARSFLPPGLDTRGTGGQIVVSPTVHPDTGETYSWVEGRAPWEITPADAPDWLYDLVTPPDVEPAPRRKAHETAAQPPSGDGPADWYRRHGPTWEELLTADGWAHGGRHYDGADMWVRPGKDPRQGHSALSDPDGPLRVFSTEAPAALLDERWRGPSGDVWILSRFDYYAATRHGGDTAAAARAIRAQRDDAIDRYVKAPPTSSSTVTDEPEPEPEAWDPDPLIPWAEADDLDNVDPFPLDVLPAWIVDAVRDVERTVQVPVDLPGMVALGALAAACTGRVRVQVARGWDEPTNLYLVVGAPPSAGKSPVFRDLLSGPLETLEDEVRDKWKAGKAEREAQQAAAAARVDQARKDGDTSELADALGALAELEEEQGAEPRLLVSDVTPEKLVDLLARQRRGLALVSAEGGPLLGLDRYREKGQAQNLDPWLQGWSGERISIDRKKEAEPIICRAAWANITMVLTVQPDVLEATFLNRTLAQRGFTARFAAVVPDSNVGGRDLTVIPDADDEIRARYRDVLGGLADRMLGLDRPFALTLDPDALTRFLRFRQELERWRGGDVVSMVDQAWSSKLESMVARTAALLAVADYAERAGPDRWPRSITVAQLERAIRLGRYWRSHWAALLGRSRRATGTMTHGERVLGKLAELSASTAGLAPVSYRDLARSLSGGTGIRADELKRILLELLDAGLVRFDPDGLGKRSGAPVTIEVHPGFVG